MMKRMYWMGLVAWFCAVLGSVAVDITLTWDPAQTTVDGDPLGPVHCYKVYYSDVAGEFVNYITVTNGTSAQLSDLEYNKALYFSVKTCTEFAESDFSDALVWTSPVMADQDEDGLSDDWERLHFGTVSAADEKSDSDQNGVSDQMEFIAGTDPLNPTDCPQLAVSADGILSFQANRPIGDGYENRVRTYSLQYCSSLADADWAPVANLEQIQAADQLVRYAMSASGQQGFYRTKISLN